MEDFYVGFFNPGGGVQRQQGRRRDEDDLRAEGVQQPEVGACHTRVQDVANNQHTHAGQVSAAEAVEAVTFCLVLA